MKENMKENITFGLLANPRDRLEKEVVAPVLRKAVDSSHAPSIHVFGHDWFLSTLFSLVTRSMAPHHDAASTKFFSFKLK